jgi:hypothetical protein
MNKVIVSTLAASLVMSQGMGIAFAKGKSHHHTYKPKATKAAQVDKDHNKIPDSFQAKYHLGYGASIASKDSDKDGLTNLQEYQLNLKPDSKDTNKNGVPDGQEDNDHDGLTNLEDIQAHMSPTNADTNHNGIKDENEDTDHDGLTTIEEFDVGTNPLVGDSNQNGVLDGQEDKDGDHLDNEAEFQMKYNPVVADSNHNGVLDGDEDQNKDGVPNENEMKNLEIKVVDQHGHQFEYKQDSEEKGKSDVKDGIGVIPVKDLINQLNIQPGMTKAEIIDQIKKALGITDVSQIQINTEFANGQHSDIQDQSENNQDEQSNIEDQYGDNHDDQSDLQNKSGQNQNDQLGIHYGTKDED